MCQLRKYWDTLKALTQGKQFSSPKEFLAFLCLAQTAVYRRYMELWEADKTVQRALMPFLKCESVIPSNGVVLLPEDFHRIDDIRMVYAGKGSSEYAAVDSLDCDELCVAKVKSETFVVEKKDSAEIALTKYPDGCLISVKNVRTMHISALDCASDKKGYGRSRDPNLGGNPVYEILGERQIRISPKDAVLFLKYFCKPTEPTVSYSTDDNGKLTFDWENCTDIQFPQEYMMEVLRKLLELSALARGGQGMIQNASAAAVINSK